MIVHAERRLRARSAASSGRNDLRLIFYARRARRRVTRRRRTLAELGLGYVAISVALAALTHLASGLALLGGLVYIAFGYMIWTVLERDAANYRGSGLHLLARPKEWQRHGTAFFQAAFALFASFCFSLVWLTLFMLLCTLVSGGRVHLDVVHVGAMQIPAVLPLWANAVVLPCILYPIVAVHRKLFRNVPGSRVATYPVKLSDRVLWNAALIVAIFAYLGLRGVFFGLPYPLATLATSALALGFTIVVAAFEVTFIDENARLGNRDAVHVVKGEIHPVAH